MIGTGIAVNFILESIRLFIPIAMMIIRPRLPEPPALIERLDNINIGINILIALTDLLQLIPHILVYLLIPTQQLIQSGHLLELASLGVVADSPGRRRYLLGVCLRVGY